MNFRFLAISLFALVAGCSSGGGGGPMCRRAGGTCSNTPDCCDGLVCTGGTCATPMMKMCSDAGVACAQTSECCQGLQCTGGKCGTPVQCVTIGNACSNAMPCCMGGTCTNGTCTGMDTRKPFGSSCTDDGECLTNLCLGIQGVSGRFCSVACNMSSTCSALSGNPPYWCVAGGNNANYCLLSCGKSTDCAKIGQDWSCRNAFDTEGLIHGICGVYRNQEEGFPCQDNAQCARGTCNGFWCAGSCVNDAACGTYAKCLFTQNQSYNCFANCTKTSDCKIYGPNFMCVSGMSRDGANVMVCSS